MARTSEEIYNDIIADQANYPALSGLTSTSGGAIYRNIVRIVANAIAIFEQLFEIFKREIDLRAAEAKVGSEAWLIAQALKFRDGYTLSVDDNYRIVYPPEALNDDASLIIKGAAVRRRFSGAQLLVVKGTPGNYEPLSNDELSRFTAYVRRIQFAGQTIVVQSLANDLLKINLTFRYDPLIPLATIQSRVDAAITNYLSSISFSNGVVNRNALIDALQAVDGYRDAFFLNLEAKGNSALVYNAFSESWTTVSGHIRLLPVALGQSIINYIPQP